MSLKPVNLQKPPIALVLSGGGALGASHLGSYAALHSHVLPEYIIGTSAGAIVGAAIACGISPEQISKHLDSQNILKLAFDFSFGAGGLIRGNKILDLLNSVYEGRNFSDIRSGITLRIFAANFNTGEATILSEGNIAEAVRASLSIPGLFPPHWINSQPLVDGGLISNLPLGPALKEYKGSHILAIDVLSCIPKFCFIKEDQPLSLRKSVERGLRIFFYQQRLSLPNDPRVFFIEPKLEDYNSADVFKLKEIESLGLKEVESCLPSLLSFLKEN